jgi:hypothetical protein
LTGGATSDRGRNGRWVAVRSCVVGTDSGRPSRWLVRLLAAAIAAELAVAGGVLATGRATGASPVAGAPDAEGGAAGGSQPADGAKKPAAPQSRPAPPGAAQRKAEVTALLARRAAAVLSRNRRAFAALLDPKQKAFVREQLVVFDNLRDVPLRSWRYDVDDRDQASRVPGLAKRYSADEVYAPEVRLGYRLRGFDVRPTELEQHLTFVRRGKRWLLAADRDFDRPGHRTARDMWDYGPVEAVRGSRTLVLGLRGRSRYLRSLARETDAAVPRVNAVWGSDWSQRVVVLVPSTQRQVSSLIGGATHLSQIAALAVAQVEEHDGGYRSSGNRVIVNPPNFNQLGALGRRIVLTHEVTHVATRDATTPRVPAWLVEGFADYVGYLNTGVSTNSAARELRADVRAGRIPAALPTDKDFHGGNKRLAQAYESSWLACKLIVERTSRAKLVKFYRTLGQARTGTDAEAVRRAMRSVLDTTPESFTSAWRSYLKAQLA